MTRTRIVLALCAPLLLLAAACQREAAWEAPVVRTWAWDEDTVEKAATVPVQDQGRVKPIDTYAQFLLLRLNKKRSVDAPKPDASGDMQRLRPIEWLLDVLLFPEQADHYRVFRIEDSEVLAAIGLSSIVRKKADRYSFAELVPGHEKLAEQWDQIRRVEEDDRSRIQNMIFELHRDLSEYAAVRRFGNFMRHEFTVPEDDDVVALIGGEPPFDAAELLQAAPKLVAALEILRQADQPGMEERARRLGLDPDALAPLREPLGRILGELQHVTGEAFALALLPPVDEATDSAPWMTPEEAARVVLSFEGSPPEEHLRILRGLQEMGRGRADAAAVAAGIDTVRAGVVPLLEQQERYEPIELEVAFYRSKLLFYSQWLYVLGFVLVALSWLAPRSRAMRWAALGGVAVPTVLLVAGITVRCILRGRPPVSTLYETILFITAVIVIVAMAIEWIQRRRVGLSVGSFLGVVGMFMASRYEISQGTDTMPQLVAVLDTNFWLATHVTTVTIGYAAGLFAGVIAHVFILGRLLGFRRGDRGFYKGIVRTVYGVIAFGLVFSVVGTILGGVWANDSWGRFWGWDPKENGALLICLVEIAIIHGRLGGILRDWGICLMAVLLNIVVAYSWWGVNMLGVGLHSYGFTDGASTLYTFYLMQGIVIGLGALTWWLERSLLAQTRTAGVGSETVATPAAAE